MTLNASFMNIPAWQGLDGVWGRRSARLATLAKDGYRDWLALLSARVEAAGTAMADLSKVRSPGDLVEVQHRLTRSATLRAKAEIEAFVGLGAALAAALVEVPAPASSVSALSAPVVDSTPPVPGDAAHQEPAYQEPVPPPPYQQDQPYQPPVYQDPPYQEPSYQPSPYTPSSDGL